MSLWNAYFRLTTEIEDFYSGRNIFIFLFFTPVLRGKYLQLHPHSFLWLLKYFHYISQKEPGLNKVENQRHMKWFLGQEDTATISGKFLSSRKTNEIVACQATSWNPSNTFCSFFLWKLGRGVTVYLLNTLFLFLITIDSGLVECFLCQAMAEPIFIILEISMSHKINLQPAVPSMGVSFLQFLK